MRPFAEHRRGYQRHGDAVGLARPAPVTAHEARNRVGVIRAAPNSCSCTDPRLAQASQ